MATGNSGPGSVADVLPRKLGLYYGGQWHEATSGRTIEAINPATGEVLATVEEAGIDDVARAVKAAREAQPAWRGLGPMQRAAMLRQMAAAVREHTEDLALLDAKDCGNPYNGMLFDMKLGATLLDYFAGLATEIKGETLPMPDSVLNYVVREPLGVVARIIAFNHPAMFFCAKVGAPLAAGNTVLVKPSEQTPLSALRLAELFGEILPAGVLNVLNGKAEAGSALAAHPDIDNVSLVGSVPTGKAVLRAAADTMKSSLMELGGKNAMIVCPDAQLEKAAASAVHGMNFGWTGGQSCGAVSRIFVHESVYDEVVEHIVKRASSIRLGMPEKPETEMGCMVSRAQYDKVLHYIAAGREDGATLLAGGEAPADPEFANGYFIPPTVFGDVTPEMRIAREEIFGPVLSVLRWSDEDELMATVNSLEYGLTAAIWSSDLATAHRMAAAVQAGYVWINGSSSHFLGAPFGGYKHSGLGREECMDELLAFTQPKNVNVTLEP